MINRFKTKDFHFVINSILKAKIALLSQKLHLNFSRTILYILENISAIFDKIHLTYEDENSHIEKVNWNCQLHLYIPENKKYIYNKLKSIHKDNNSYSIAKNLRYAIKIFIRGIEFYGFDKFMLILERAEEKWRNRINNQVKWNKKKKEIQLLQKIFISTQYDINYLPILIKFNHLKF